jgi:uncharacterized protein (DUF4415 family)
MKSKLVTVEMKDGKFPPLTKKQKERFDALTKRPDSRIDYSDIPALDDAFWKTAVRGGLYLPRKESTTVRLDADVLAWLRSQGKGYQTRINAILRREMLSAPKR